MLSLFSCIISMSKKESKGLGGKNLVYDAPIPKFLQQMVGKEKVEAALQQDRDKKKIEMPDREEDDNPVIEADESLMEEYRKQQELIKVCPCPSISLRPHHLFSFIQIIYIY
jgi:hypothetical protein